MKVLQTIAIATGLIIGAGVPYLKRSENEVGIASSEMISDQKPGTTQVASRQNLEELGENWRHLFILGLAQSNQDTVAQIRNLAKAEPIRFLEILDALNSIEPWASEFEQAVTALRLPSEEGASLFAKINSPAIRESILLLATSQALIKSDFSSVAGIFDLSNLDKDQNLAEKICRVLCENDPEASFRAILNLKSPFNYAAVFLTTLAKTDLKEANRLAMLLPKNSREGDFVRNQLQELAISNRPGPTTLEQISKDLKNSDRRVIPDLTSAVVRSFSLEPKATFDWVIAQKSGPEKHAILTRLASQIAQSQPQCTEELLMAFPNKRMQSHIADQCVTAMLQAKSLTETRDWAGTFADPLLKETVRGEIFKRSWEKDPNATVALLPNSVSDANDPRAWERFFATVGVDPTQKINTENPPQAFSDLTAENLGKLASGQRLLGIQRHLNN